MKTLPIFNLFIMLVIGKKYAFATYRDFDYSNKLESVVFEPLGTSFWPYANKMAYH